MAMVGGIYAIVHRESGRKYVGSTRSFRCRFRKHRSELERGTHGNPHLQRSWTKHGGDAFKFIVLEVVADWHDLPAREQAHLDSAKTEGDVFNCGDWTDCPARGVPKTSEQRAKIGAAHRGRKHSAEHIARYIASRTGQPPNMEAARKAAEANRGRKHSAEWVEAQRRGNVGKHHWTPEMIAALKAKWTPEKREAMSAARRGRPTSLRGKKKSPEHAAKLRARLIALANEFRHKPRSPEARLRMAEAARLAWANGKRRQAENRRREEAA